MQKTPGQKNKLDNLFDETPGYDDEAGVKFSPGLTAEQKAEATALYRLFNGFWGVAIVTAEPGMGKDTFGNWLTYRIKQYFPHKRILRDERPRELFGPYAGIFDEESLVSDLAIMRAQAKGLPKDQVDAKLTALADKWVEQKGRALLQNSVLYLTEFWRYCSRREPMSPMNKTMGGIHKEKRHMDLFEIGTTQMVEDLDRKTCLPWVDWRVQCTRSRVNTTGFIYYVNKVKYHKRIDKLENLGAPFKLPYDAGKPDTSMGDGKIVLLKHDYYPVSDEERIILDVIKAGGDNYEEIRDFIMDNGDMTENEILDTMKELTFRKNKRAIWYPCGFRLFNSKSAPNMKTSVKVGEL